ncbi:PREDICTED: subtilisin-like protease SBT4.15 [Tarenaya hassleriana]|uniref:subtilisin-like protease SBT4.15 n=1 Tax=Tarenaya hassleriana TaxID=28532 RepID=UPI00053C289E|nr:PREDICTED: subtilisin-like protease SBT4.15 [Tarenaya hassleriana]
MKITLNPRFRVFVLCFYLFNVASEAASDDGNEERKPYIVYMGEPVPGANPNSLEHHHNLLLTAIGDERRAREVRIHSYGKSINGFAARLLPHEAEKLSREEGVVSVFESTRRKLHTTRSWDFLGMKESKYQRRIPFESNIIVGVLDTGIYMESPSFKDEGFGPPPARWKGKCVTGPNLTHCNNKVIGAKYFRLEYPNPGEKNKFSAADEDGHGTHTTSTVAGISVSAASFYGIANGTARGGVPSARIAAYKVCWEDGCSDMDLLAAFDEAIWDGVDIISVSIGGASSTYFQDPIAIGAFHAMKKGILTSCSAGNNGPDLFTVANSAPWIMTVAASSLDRKFQTLVKLGNGLSAPGISLNTFSPKKKMYPLTSGFLASNVSEDDYGNPSLCDYGTMGEDKVKGRVVYCEEGSSGQDSNIKNLRGEGVIIQLEEPTDIASATLISATYVSYGDGAAISRYINSTKNPRAVIHKTTSVRTVAPSIASFSSRGPQLISPDILKPDLSAPGLNILAAYSKFASITGYPDDKRQTLYSILSGTSMACPHATAAAAYVKSFHPNWSPAAIKSALMTTAKPMRVKGKDICNASKAETFSPEPILRGREVVYDNSMSSYIRYLCKEKYNDTMIRVLVGGRKEYKCKDFKHGLGTDGLNYPSMHKQLRPTDKRVNAVFYRTVTNVGFGYSVYVARVRAPKGMKVEVRPRILRFVRPGERRSFKVVINGVWVKNWTGVVSGSLQWNDLRGHRVRSPILLFKPDHHFT